MRNSLTRSREHALEHFRRPLSNVTIAGRFGWAGKPNPAREWARIAAREKIAAACCLPRGCIPPGHKQDDDSTMKAKSNGGVMVPEPVRSRAFLPLRNLRREIDSLFGDYFTFDDDLTTPAWTPRADLSESEKEYKIQIDLPGVKKEDITVKVEDNRLVIKGERKEEKKEEGEDYIRTERSYGSFFRTMVLPLMAEPDKIDATFIDGELVVKIPKVETVKPTTVSIK